MLANSVTTAAHQMKVFKPFRLDTVNQCLWRAESRMPLTPKAFDVLRYLVEHAGRLVTPDEVLEALWPETYINPEGIRKYVLEIRKVLGDRRNQPLFIETLPKRGYQFIATVTDDRTLPPPGAEIEASNVVGRDALLAQLNGRFEKALVGQRQVIFVTGEAGIGKTTLVDVFQQQATRRPNLRLARGQCIEGFGGKEAYYPILEAIEAMTAQGPLIMVLEDLHWVDNSTLDVISVLARRRVPAKLLLIATYRPADVLLFQGQLKTLKQDLLVHHLCHEITVERLEEADVAEYLAVAFADSDFPSGLAELIHHNSGGNALFMTGIVRDIAERGSIVQEGGKWVLTAPLQDIYPGIPETLQQMLENQFEQLSAEEQRILETCSVAGERFSVWAAAAMLETLPTSIEETCDRLAQRQQFIRFVGIQNAANGADSAHYEFRHSLYRQALYRQLSSANRSKLHRSLGEWLMAAYTAGRRELASELALHFEVGRDFEQAARCLIWTAENAARRFAHGDSIRSLQLALELAQSLPARTRIELEIEVLQRMGDAHFALGAMSDSALAYETAAARAAEAGLRKTQIEALARLAVPAWYLDPPRGNDICEQAVEESRAHGDPLLLAQTQLATACFRLLYDTWRNQDAETCASARHTIRRLSGPSTPENMFCVYVQAMQGDYEEALKQAGAAMIATTSPAAYLLALGAKILSLMQCGRFGEVLRIVGTGRELAQKNGEDPWVFIFREAWLRSLCFDFEGVLRLSRTAMRSDAKQHAVPWTAIGMISAGYAELSRGRYPEALQCFAQVRDPGITPNFFLHWYWRMQARLGSSEVRLQAGDIPNARIEVDDLLESALSTADPHLQALAWEAKARVAMAEQDSDGARRCIENALAILDKVEIPVAAWQVHATAWQFYRHTKEDKPAEASRGRAEACILKIANSFARDEPLRASFLSAPPIARVLGASENKRAVS